MLKCGHISKNHNFTTPSGISHTFLNKKRKEIQAQIFESCGIFEKIKREIKISVVAAMTQRNKSS